MPSYPTKVLNGEAVGYMARGTNSSMILFTDVVLNPAAKPRISLARASTQKFMTYIRREPMVEIRATKIRVLRRPLTKNTPAERAPKQAPTLYILVSV